MNILCKLDVCVVWTLNKNLEGEAVFDVFNEQNINFEKCFHFYCRLSSNTARGYISLSSLREWWTSFIGIGREEPFHYWKIRFILWNKFCEKAVFGCCDGLRVLPITFHETMLPKLANSILCWRSQTPNIKKLGTFHTLDFGTGSDSLFKKKKKKDLRQKYFWSGSLGSHFKGAALESWT